VIHGMYNYSRQTPGINSFPTVPNAPNHMDVLATSNLALGNWSDPAKRQVDDDRDYTDDPKYLAVVRTIVTEDNGENDSAQVTHGTGETRDDTIGVWVNVRYKRVIGPIATFEEEGHTSDESEHGARVLGVGETNGNEESTSDDSVDVDERLLSPHTRAAVQEIGENPTSWPEHNVEQTKHGSPSSSPSLSKRGEVLQVVGTED